MKFPKWPVVSLLAVLAAQAASTAAEKKAVPPPNPFVVSTVVDALKGTTLPVAPYLSLVFPPQVFSEDTAVTAKLDPVSGKLTLSSRGGALKPQRIQVNLDLTQLPKGLQLEHSHKLDTGARFDGVLTELSNPGRPLLVATTANGLEPILVDQSTIILLSENGKRARQDKWDSLSYGDSLRVRYARGRRADLIEVSRVTGEGVIHHQSENRLALAGVAKPLIVNAQARLEDTDGKPLQLASLQPEDKISYRQHPETEEVWYLKRTMLAAKAAPRLVVNHDGLRPLLPGDRVRIRASGTPKATVTFDLIGVESDLEARELRELPGTYERVYTVPRGVKVAEARVVARLRLADGRTNTVLAEQPLKFGGTGTATTTTTTPTTVKPDRQPPGKLKAPAIVEPKEGARVGETMVVSGTATPGQKVKVVIDYVVTKSIFKLAEGRLVEVEAMADAKGNWRTKELETKVVTLIKGDVDYTLTAVSVAADGTESEPTVVKVRRPK